MSTLARLATAWWNRRHPDWVVPADGRVAPHLELSARTLPRHLADRARLAVDRRRHGTDGRPWLTAEATALLQTLLRPTDRVLEFGSGGSTVWLAQRVASVRSVEAADRWYEEVVARLKGAGIDNVDLVHVPTAELGYETEAHREAYVDAHPDLQPGSLDLVLVDGEYRDRCALRGLELLAPGGILVLDNANTYIPGETRAPWRIAVPASPGWERFLEQVSGWRHVWTTNGSWATALWFKP